MPKEKSLDKDVYSSLANFPKIKSYSLRHKSNDDYSGLDSDSENANKNDDNLIIIGSSSSENECELVSDEPANADKQCDDEEKHESTSDYDDENESGSNNNDLSWDSDSDNDPERLWCICLMPWDTRFMIMCDECLNWYHGDCVGLAKEDAKRIKKNDEKYCCPFCKKDQFYFDKFKDQINKIGFSKKSPYMFNWHNKADLEKRKLKKLTKCVNETASDSIQSSNISIDDKTLAAAAAASGTNKSSLTNVKPLTAKPAKKCIHSKCSKSAMKNIDGAIYCSDNCIHSYINEFIDKIGDDDIKLFNTLTKKIFTCQLNKLTNKVNEIKEYLFKLIKAKPYYRFSNRNTTTTTATTTSNNNSSNNNEKSYLTTKLNDNNLSKTKSTTSQSYTPKNVITKVQQSKESNLNEKKFAIKHAVDRKPEQVVPWRLLSDALKNRLSETDDMKLKDEITNKSFIDDICKKIHEEMIKFYGDSNSIKYKNKLCSLMFNVKDKKNNLFYKKIIKSEYDAKELVHMSSEEMASQELSEWREKEMREEIKAIEKAQKEAAKDAKLLKQVKLTHKGEIFVRDEDMSDLNGNIRAKKSTTTLPTTPQNNAKVTKTNEDAEMPVTPTEVNNKTEEKKNDQITDTTHEHNKHLFDIYCKICTGVKIVNKPKPNDNLSRQQSKTSKESSEINNEHSNNDLAEKSSFTYKNTSIPTTTNDQKIRNNVAINKDLDNNFPNNTFNKNTTIQIQPNYNTQDYNDKFLKEPTVIRATYGPTKPIYEPTNLNLNSKTSFSTVFWSGFIIVPDMGKMLVNASMINDKANTNESMLYNNELFPSKIEHLGRVQADELWYYINNLKQTRDIFLIKIELCDTNTKENEGTFIKYIGDLQSRNRFARIKAFGDIKDFYLIPITKDHKPSDNLLSLLKDCNLNLNEQKDFFIGILTTKDDGFAKRRIDESAPFLKTDLPQKRKLSTESDKNEDNSYQKHVKCTNNEVFIDPLQISAAAKIAIENNNCLTEALATHQKLLKEKFSISPNTEVPTYQANVVNLKDPRLLNKEKRINIKEYSAIKQQADFLSKTFNKDKEKSSGEIINEFKGLICNTNENEAKVLANKYIELLSNDNDKAQILTELQSHLNLLKQKNEENRLNQMNFNVETASVGFASSISGNKNTSIVQLVQNIIEALGSRGDETNLKKETFQPLLDSLKMLDPEAQQHLERHFPTVVEILHKYKASIQSPSNLSNESAIGSAINPNLFSSGETRTENAQYLSSLASLNSQMQNYQTQKIIPLQKTIPLISQNGTLTTQQQMPIASIDSQQSLSNVPDQIKSLNKFLNNNKTKNEFLDLMKLDKVPLENNNWSFDRTFFNACGNIVEDNTTNSKYSSNNNAKNNKIFM